MPDSPHTADIVERLLFTAEALIEPPTGNYGGVRVDAAKLVREAAAEIKALREALRLWLAYDDQDEADFAQAGPLLLYARAIDATRAALKDHRKVS